VVGEVALYSVTGRRGERIEDRDKIDTLVCEQANDEVESILACPHQRDPCPVIWGH
jgi:hypothetical protein